MAEIINGVPIGDLPGIESVPDDSMLVVEFLGKAYHMPGAVLRQMIQDVLDSMGDSVDDVTEARLTAAIETVLSSGKYNGVSPLVEVLDEEDGTSVIHIIDAFGVKKYPVEVKGARNAVQYVEQELTEEQKAQARENIGIGEIGNSVVVELSGNPTDGYTALLSGEAVTGDELDEMAKNGSHITGVATESLVFQVSNGINGASYTVPNGTIFSYGNAIVTGNPGFYGTGGVHSFEFRVCLQDYNFAIAYKAVANQDEKVWVSATQATHMVFRLGISRGIPAVLYGTQMLYGNSVPNMNYLYTILAESQLLNRPVFCYQVNMPFYTDDGTEMTPYSGVLFSLKINSAYQYFFEAEHEGYVYRFTVKQNEGYSCTAEPTEVYKKVQSKADDLKEEDGTLFLLSAGEPIGAGVTLPTGNADDSKIFIADLNTSTYEDIKAADDAGKICYALWGGYTPCMLTTLSGDSAIFTTLLDPHLGKYVKFTKGTVGVSDFGLTESHSVLYEPQSLTDAQKAQARENIGALSADDIDVDSIGSNVFVGKYDTVTFTEIKTAHDAGKVCFLNFDGLMIPLLNLSDTDALFVREINSTTDFKVTITSDSGKDFTLVDKNTPIYVAQTLTDDQKAQARTNIGAMSTGDVNTVLQQAKDSGQFDGPAGPAGPAGPTGATGPQGPAGATGANGKTAYAYAQDGGYTGTEAEFAAKLASESDSVFVADYDTTTFAEVKAAHNAGKVCFVKSDGMPFCQLLGIDDSEAIFIREINDTADYKVTFTSAGGKDFTLVDKNTPIYVAQTLSDAQKAQARTNIGAAAAADLSKYVTTGTAQTITGVKTFNAPANVAGTEQHTVKFKTSNGGAIIFGKEAANSGTMLRFDQVDGTTRLRFRGSDSAGAIVWEQPEQGAQLYVDLGKEGVDKRRITFPSSAGTLALTSQIPSLSGYLPLSGGLMTGPIKFQAASLPGKSLQYVCGVDAFTNGGEMGWQSKADFLSGYLTTTGTAARATADANGNNIASTYLPKSGGTMTGALNLKNSTWNLAGDDAYFGDNDTAGSFAIKGANGTTNLKMVTHNGTTYGTLSWNGSNFAFSNALNFHGGTLTGDLTVGSAKIQTNGYVVGTWLQTTANNATTSKVDQVCVQSNGWIYTRTLDQLRNDMNAASKDEVVTAANGSLKVTLSGNSTDDYTVDKTLAQIETALNAGRHVYMVENDGQVYQLSMHMAGMMACFTSVVTSGTQVTVITVIVYDGMSPSVIKKTL